MKKPTPFRYLILVSFLFIGFTAQAHHHSKNDTTVYVTAEKMPAFPGGPVARNTFIAKNIKFPSDAVKNHVTGTVYVTFVVERNGSISQIKVLKGIGHGCDEEAMKVISEMPKWTPGIIKGKSVRVRETLPFLFNIQSPDKIYTRVDQYPVFDYPGGLKSYLKSNIQYPKGIVKNKIIDTVKVFFVVNPDKSITQVTINKDSSALNAYDYEAIRLVKNVKIFRPAYVQLHAVRVRMYMPIVFDYRKVDTSANGNAINDRAYAVVDQMPSFPGGEQALMRYLGEHIHYPELAKKNGWQGRVFINFIVEPDGSISHIRVLRGPNPILDLAAIKVVSNMPKWIPGIQKGKKVRVSFNLPIKFSLE